MNPHTMLVLGCVAIAAVQRLAELWLAARRLRASAADTGADFGTGSGGDPGAASPPDPAFPLLVLLHTGWLVASAAEPLLWPRPLWPTLALAMAALWGAALALRIWTLHTLGRYWHVRIIRRARQPVVTDGPYRFIRHPNYVVVALEIAALPLLVGAYWTALLASLANAGALALRIRHEEAYLFQVPGYREAFARKARFIPGVF